MVLWATHHQRVLSVMMLGSSIRWVGCLTAHSVSQHSTPAGCCLLPPAARNSREAAVGVSALGSALQQTLQQSPAGIGQGGPMPPQTTQMMAGLIASEVVPLVKAELAGALGPWLAESNAALKRLDTRLAVSNKQLQSVHHLAAQIAINRPMYMSCLGAPLSWLSNFVCF